MNKKAIAILGAIFVLIVGTLGFLIVQRRNAANQTPEPGPVTDSPTDTSNDNPIFDNDTPSDPQDPIPDPVTPDDPVVPDDDSGTPPTDFGPSPVNVSSEQMVSPILFYQGNGVAYFTTDGRLFQGTFSEASGQAELTDYRELALPPKSGVSKVRWPLFGNNFLIEQGNGWPKVYSVYASAKGDYVDLPKEVYAVDWLPDGEQLLYFWVDSSGKATLNVSPADFSTWDTIVDIWEPDNALAIAPDGKTLLFWRTKNEGAQNSINLVTTDGKIFRSVIKDGYNTGAVWSPDSQKFAFLKRLGGNEELWVGNMLTGQGVSTGLATNLEKLVWSQDGKQLYAAARSVGGYDELYKIDPSTGQSTVVPVLGGLGSARDMFFSLDGKRLYFYNNQSSGLYYVEVP